MRRYLRLLLCLPLLAATACAAAIAGPACAPAIAGPACAAACAGPAIASEPVVEGPSAPASISIVLDCACSTNSSATVPLYIIDGVITSSTQAMAGLKAEDIHSIEVLLGGAAASLYGSRAAHGVVMITTRAAANRRQ